MAINNYSNSNSKSEARTSKFINFLLLINQNILMDLQLQF